MENNLAIKRGWAKRERLTTKEKCLFSSAVWAVVATIGLWVICGFLIVFTSCQAAHADEIDMKKIAAIESSNCKYKIGDGNKSWGCYQVNDALLDWNKAHPKERYSYKQMMNDALCLKVASWYMNKKIPAYLKHFKIKDTPVTRISSYNWGIGNVVKWQRNGGFRSQLPIITATYLKKYGA